MLDADYLFNVADDIVELYEQLNTFGINDICRRLVNADFQLTGSAEWQYYLLQQTGMSRNEINKKIAQITKKSEQEIKAIFEESSYRSYNADMSVYEKAGITALPFSQSERMLQILDATYRATLGELHNLTMTTADASQELLINTLNETQWKVATGMQSKNQAIAEAIEKVAGNGIDVMYSEGVRRSIESVVRMCVTTGINQACSQISLQNCESMGTDLVLTSSHPGARTGEGYKGHVNWQGRIFSLSGTHKRYPSFAEECGYGKMLGICGINCRHSFLPYIEGVSHNPFERYDSQKEQEKYAKQQKQRRMERDIRTTKRQLQAMQESINATAETDVKEVLQEKYDRLAYKLQNQRANYSKFCDDNKLVPQAERMKVARFSRSEAQKAVWGAKRHERSMSNRGVARNAKTMNDNHKMGALNLGFDKTLEKYIPKEDFESVEKAIDFAKDVLGVKNVGFGGLKNAEQIMPFLKKLESIKKDYGTMFTNISVVEMSLDDLAMVTPDRRLVLNQDYFNSSALMKDGIAEMKKYKILPKQAGIEYIAAHEWGHFISIYDLNDSKSPMHVLYRRREVKHLISFNQGKNVQEFVADCIGAALCEIDCKYSSKVIEYYIGK